MKTPDEIKKGLECCRECQDCTQDNMPKCPYYEKETCLIELVDDALALIHQLEAQVTSWISVEERLPDVNADVVLIIQRNDGPCIRVGWLREYGRWWAAGQGIVPYEVTHWMPLHEPPEA